MNPIPQGTSQTTVKIDPFNSKTGAGTLSYYAKQYGTDVGTLQKLNNITDPNKISAGSNLIVPTPNIQTTNKIGTDIKNNLTTLDGINSTVTANMTGGTGIATGGAPAGGGAPAVDQATQTQLNRATDQVQGIVDNGNSTRTVTYKDGQTQIIQGSDTSKGDTSTGGGGLSDGSIPKQIQDAQSSYESIVTNIIIPSLNSAKLTADANNLALIKSIQDKYAARRVQVSSVNESMKGSVQSTGFRSGRTRNMSLIQDGIISQEELDGIQRLKDLDAEEASLIAEANTAKTAKDFEYLSNVMSAYDKVYTNKTNTLQNLYTQALAFEKNALDKVKQSSDAAKQEFDLGQKKAESVAPGIADKYFSLKDPSKQEQFLQEISTRLGVDPDMLRGYMTEANQKAQESAATVGQKNRSNIPKNTSPENDTITNKSKNQKQYYFVPQAGSADAKSLKKLGLDGDQVSKLQGLLMKGYTFEELKSMYSIPDSAITILKKYVKTQEIKKK